MLPGIKYNSLFNSVNKWKADNGTDIQTKSLKEDCVIQDIFIWIYCVNFNRKNLEHDFFLH